MKDIKLISKIIIYVFFEMHVNNAIINSYLLNFINSENSGSVKKFGKFQVRKYLTKKIG